MFLIPPPFKQKRHKMQSSGPWSRRPRANEGLGRLTAAGMRGREKHKQRGSWKKKLVIRKREVTKS